MKILNTLIRVRRAIGFVFVLILGSIGSTTQAASTGCLGGDFGPDCSLEELLAPGGSSLVPNLSAIGPGGHLQLLIDDWQRRGPAAPEFDLSVIKVLPGIATDGTFSLVFELDSSATLEIAPGVSQVSFGFRYTLSSGLARFDGLDIALDFTAPGLEATVATAACEGAFCDPGETPDLADSLLLNGLVETESFGFDPAAVGYVDVDIFLSNAGAFAITVNSLALTQTVSAIPVPAAVWLLLPALATLRVRKKA